MNKYFIMIIMIYSYLQGQTLPGFNLNIPSLATYTSCGYRYTGTPQSINLSWTNAPFTIPGTVLYQVKVFLNSQIGPLVYQSGLIQSTNMDLFLTNPPFERSITSCNNNNNINPNKRYYYKVEATLFGGENGNQKAETGFNIFYFTNKDIGNAKYYLGDIIKLNPNLFGEIHTQKDTLGVIVKNEYSEGLGKFEIFKSGDTQEQAVLTYYDYLEKGENVVKIPLHSLNVTGNSLKFFYLRYENEDGNYSYALIKLKNQN